mmetsp:Transcript_7574/g.13226  ORF Transcript_7574/g.13226 Transcript_7574/m.13226 type:complete len:135 (-) Transcript_7574:171-575(-)
MSLPGRKGGMGEGGVAKQELKREVGHTRNATLSACKARGIAQLNDACIQGKSCLLLVEMYSTTRTKAVGVLATHTSGRFQGVLLQMNVYEGTNQKAFNSSKIKRARSESLVAGEPGVQSAASRCILDRISSFPG